MDKKTQALLGEVLEILYLIPHNQILRLADLGKDLRGYQDSAAAVRLWMLSVEAAKKRVKLNRKLALACKEDIPCPNSMS